ncbi:hypothetical protein FGO68_gene15980 [Halteria grandinella]|uniref:Uncharacterized protein n=1 Tax=Halteria grandinella TaxID=5974 RepID=A0A8J8SYN6_HALGN|nr:hypothetical protein FGO68_gene15980 [Halteria grandinella]
MKESKTDRAKQQQQEDQQLAPIQPKQKKMQAAPDSLDMTIYESVAISLDPDYLPTPDNSLDNQEEFSEKPCYSLHQSAAPQFSHDAHQEATEATLADTQCVQSQQPNGDYAPGAIFFGPSIGTKRSKPDESEAYGGTSRDYALLQDLSKRFKSEGNNGDGLADSTMRDTRREIAEKLKNLLITDFEKVVEMMTDEDAEAFSAFLMKFQPRNR